MFHFATLLNKFRRTFTPLEEKILTEVGDKLEPRAKSLFEKQISEINLVQRDLRKETNFYSIKGGKAVRNSNYQFPNKTGDLVFAKISFRLPDESEIWKVALHSVKGFIFSLVFDKDPSAIKKRSDLIDIVVEISTSVLKQVPEQPERIAQRIHFTGWLQEWMEKYGFKEIIPPIKEEDKKRFINNVEVPLPSEYLEVSNYCDGLIVADCKIFGLSEIYEVVMPEHNYIVLAEIPSVGVIASKKISPFLLVFLDFVMDRNIELGNSFKPAVETVLDNPTVFRL